jgi:TonB family protein
MKTQRKCHFGSALLCSLIILAGSAAAKDVASSSEPVKIDLATGVKSLRKNPKLAYPSKERGRGIQGTVELELTVSPKGDVLSERAVSGDPELQKAAMKAFKKAKYSPFLRDGKPSAALVKACVRFGHDDVVTMLDRESPPTSGQGNSGIDIISDTMGVDFVSYLRQIAKNIKENWYRQVPEEARNQTAKGQVVIQFAILQDGRVSAMRLERSSGQIPLDRAAWGGISASNPLPALPSEFRGKYLLLRFTFAYNPEGGIVKP